MAATVGVLLALAAAGTASAQDTIRIGSEGAYPPWNLTRPDGTLGGFEIDLANALCQHMNARCEFVAQDWDGMIPALISGRYDAIMAGMTITDERRERIAFSNPYATTPAWFVARQDSPLQQARTAEEVFAALAGKTVGVQTATIHNQFLQQQVPGATLRVYETQEQLNLDLAAGRIDAGLADSTAWDPFLASADGAGFRHFGPSFTGRDFPIFGEGIGIGLRQGDTALRERFNQALCEMQRDGSLAALATQWFGYDTSLPCPG